MTKKQIIDFITSKGVQLAKADYWLIKEFQFNEKLMRDSKVEIRTHGILVNMSTKPGIESWQKNQAIAVYDQALKNLASISQKLGLSPVDRQKLINETVAPPKLGFDLDG